MIGGLEHAKSALMVAIPVSIVLISVLILEETFPVAHPSFKVAFIVVPIDEVLFAAALEKPLSEIPLIRITQAVHHLLAPPALLVVEIVPCVCLIGGPVLSGTEQFSPRPIPDIAISVRKASLALSFELIFPPGAGEDLCVKFKGAFSLKEGSVEISGIFCAVGPDVGSVFLRVELPLSLEAGTIVKLLDTVTMSEVKFPLTPVDHVWGLIRTLFRILLAKE